MTAGGYSFSFVEYFPVKKKFKFALEGVYLKKQQQQLTTNQISKQNKTKTRKDRRTKKRVLSRIRTRNLRFHATSP